MRSATITSVVLFKEILSTWSDELLSALDDGLLQCQAQTGQFKYCQVLINQDKDTPLTTHVMNILLESSAQYTFPCMVSVSVNGHRYSPLSSQANTSSHPKPGIT